jgi:hypothetical protein
MTYKIQTVSDAGRVALGGPKKGELVERRWEKNYDTLSEAIEEYGKFVDHGFAAWEYVVSIVDANGEVLATKTFLTPTGV